MRFADRREAGEALAAAVAKQNPTDPVVYGLPRGGVPVAYEVAIALRCPLDVLSVAKVGVPGQPELALGAVADDGISVRNDDLLSQLGISPADFENMARQVSERLDTNWRGTVDPVPAENKTAIIVDDGVATGATARVAVEVLRGLGSREVWLAVPVAPRELDIDVDQLIMVHRPRRFFAVGHWYDDFRQTTGEEVRILLERSRLP